ncbi:hypothetical protein GOP47_0006083 [Adiantum capillus-veneris]|uniref:RAVE complex protein Rav1 C-terminal domain-containing protein n=1 Tax=Adiantum capillus-veneris TaxID=13818 RepID=A0A9D4ZLP7_ADICA|nr:hypothetical protein GOP47_0006083 [Adiantum capillus-veneris]
MDSNKAPLSLEVKQRSFPISSGSPSQTVDWLPNFFGSSWVAYASPSSLVISIVPSPTSTHEEKLGLCQVIDNPHDAPARILCVRWAPSPIGLLGASCEHLIWIYTPQFSNTHEEHNSPDFPRGWVLADKLRHTFKVWSFGWTESGDGLLSVGTEVTMWKQDETGWRCLWTSPVMHPQVFAAATWSANGLAATAEGRNSQADDSNQSATKGKATVWWWEDSLGLLESELVHPKEIVFLQWRPSKGPLGLKEAFRPVLLTACKDGAVRLWLEIDSGRARLDKASGKDVSSKHLKPAYFVSAVIEAEQSLHGVLGADVFVSWPLQCRAEKSNSTSARSSTAITKMKNSGSCEWLVGLGPEGSIFLWSVFCLDDIYPPRCPRIFLWKQASGVLAIPLPHAGFDIRQVFVKIVAQRLSSRLTDPPFTLDLFYTSQPTLFQWSRIWPPIIALCGDSLKESESPEVDTHERAPTKTKKDVWGVVTENFNLHGHSDNIISIAVHPISFIGLVATVDSQGHICLWCTSCSSNKRSSLFSSVWRPSGESVVALESNILTWLPAVLSGGQTVLLLTRAGNVDCYLISEVQNTIYRGQPLAVKLLCSLNLAVRSPEQFLAIWALPFSVQTKNFVIVGLGKASGKLVSCDLQIIEGEINSHDRDQDPSDQVGNGINLLVKKFSSRNFGALESFISVAFPPVSFLPFLQTHSNSITYEPLDSSHFYDIATGSEDGALRLWKKDAQYSTDNSEVAIKDDVWQCVGFMKVSSGPVTMIAIGCFGLKMATWCPTSVDTYGEGILIWSIERVSDRAMLYLSDRVSLVGSPTSMQWLDLGNGGSFLGLLMQTELQVYTESRVFDKRLESFAPSKNQEQQSSEQFSWRLLASRALFYRTSCFSWGPKGSLLVTFKEHLLVYDLADVVTRVQNQVNLKYFLGSQRDHTWSLVTAGTILSSPLPAYHPVAMLYHLYTGNHQRARACLGYLQQNLSGLFSSTQGELPCGGLLQIYSPAQLLEIFLKEVKSEKNDRKTEAEFLSWGAGNASELEDYAASFSRVSLAGDDISKADTHHESETSNELNVEKLEFLLAKFADGLGLKEEHRMQLLNVADVLVKMDSESKALEYASLDRPGQRFWLAVQLSHSRQRKKGGMFVRTEDLCLDAKAMAWAFQSECKDTLLDLCLGSEISWPAMRALGAGFWLTDISQLRSRMEKLARAQYLLDKSPKRCALLYLALQRKNVLMGLFKLSKDEKDRVLYEFLGRDFSLEKNTAAALKNAYVLLGKHQHDLAAAFFLLGGDLSSAASACAKNLGDLQLALVICRLFEGINGPNEQRLVKEYGLKKAQNERDYWLASLFQWLMGERTKAIEEMIGHLGGVFESSYEDRESGLELHFPDAMRGAFQDPDIGIFCLHLASKPVMQLGVNNAAMTVFCKWLCSRTSATLERLGLPLEALEYLCLSKDSFGTNLQPKNDDIFGAVATHISDFKNTLALQFQAQLVMAHPCWLVGTHTGLNGAGQEHVCTSATDASKQLLQSLNLLDHHFTVDSQYVAAEISRFANCHNMGHLQSVFARGVSDAYETQDFHWPVMKSNGEGIASHDSGEFHEFKEEKSVGHVMGNGNGEVTSNSTPCTAVDSVCYKMGEEVFHSNGDLLEEICVNSCCPDQVVVASSRKGLLYFDINTGKSFSYSESNLWSRAEWPKNGWANSESTPVPTFVSPGVGLRSKEGPSVGLGGATVGVGLLNNVVKESSFKGVGVGIPGYGGMGALGLGWEEWEDYEGVVDPLATMENVNTQAMDSHPLRPLFLVGSRNTHVYLWEFGKSSATATYGILPAANVPPPYALASVSSVKFDHSGHRFATSAIDGTVCTWQLEVGGRSNVRPTDSCLCFDRHASDVAFVGGSGGIIAATGASQNNFNLVFWDTLAPVSTSQAFVYCHEGGARCLEMFDQHVGGGSISSLIVTCGKGGDVAVHDFRYIATGKTKRAKNLSREHGSFFNDQSSSKQQDGDLNVDGSVWYIAKAHSGSITCVSAVPGTSLFFTGSKDGDVKLWDANKCELVIHWHRVHDKHMFLQHNARGFGAVVQESRGFGGIFQHLRQARHSEVDCAIFYSLSSYANTSMDGT